MNSGKSECSSPVSSISAQVGVKASDAPRLRSLDTPSPPSSCTDQEMAVGYKAQQMMIVQPAETRGPGHWP